MFDSKKWHREWYLKNKKSENLKGKFWRENHKKEIKEYCKKYWEKNKNKRVIYRINEKITDDTARYLADYFKYKPEYILEMTKCRNCTNVYEIKIRLI
jgi:hypothetical protein